MALAGCGGALASFDPDRRLHGDGVAPRAPTRTSRRGSRRSYEDRGPTDARFRAQLHRARTSAASPRPGIAEVRFAGGTWDVRRRIGRPSSSSSRRPGLTATRSPTSTPRARRRPTGPRSPASRTPTIAGRAGPSPGLRRPATALQTVVVWPAADSGRRQRRHHQRPARSRRSRRRSRPSAAFGPAGRGARVAAMSDRPDGLGARHAWQPAPAPRARSARRRFSTISDMPIERLYGPWSLARRRRGDGSASRASRRSPAASTRPAIESGCGRCGCSRASGRPRTRTRASTSCSPPGRPGLSIAYDMPTLYGYDTDDPEAEGEFGTCGVGGQQPGRHGGPARRPAAGPGQHLDDDQLAGRADLGDVHRGRREGRASRATAWRAPPRTTSSRSSSPRRSSCSRPSRRCAS